MRMIKTIAKWVAGATIAGAMMFAVPQQAAAQSNFSFGVSVGNGGYYRPYNNYYSSYYSPYNSGYYPSYYSGYYARPYPAYGGYYSRPYYGHYHHEPRGHAYGYYRHHR